MTDWKADTWIPVAQRDILAVQVVMAEPLSSNPSVLYDQLSKAEAWYPRLTELTADANARLDEAEYQSMLDHREEDLFAAEKEKVIAHEVSGDRRMRDICDGLCKAVNNRLILGMSLRRTHAGERSDY